MTDTETQVKYALLAILLVCGIYMAYVLIPAGIRDVTTFKPEITDCSLLTNDTYDNYSNSNHCLFNGTGWEPLFWGKTPDYLRGPANGCDTEVSTVYNTT